MIDQFGQGRQPHRHPVQQTAAQLLTQFQNGFRGGAERGFVYRDQQQGQAAAAPMALEQPQFGGHRIHQLLGIFRQIEGAPLQHRWQEGQAGAALAALVAIQPGRGHGLDAHGRMASEAQPAVGAHLGQAQRQFPGAGDAQLRRGAIMGQRQAGLAQGRGDRLIGRHQGHHHL